MAAYRRQPHGQEQGEAGMRPRSENGGHVSGTVPRMRTCEDCGRQSVVNAGRRCWCGSKWAEQLTASSTPQKP
jgi:hypothetical protein